MKIDANAIVIASRNDRAAKPAEAEPGDFERLLDEASSETVAADLPKEPPADAPQALDVEKTPEQVQEAVTEETTEEPQDVDSQAGAVLASIAPVVGISGANDADASEIATESAGKSQVKVAPEAISIEVKAHVASLVVDVQQGASGNENAEPQGAAVAHAAAVEPEVAVHEAAYKPMMSAKPQAAESRDNMMDTAPAKPVSPELSISDEGALQQQGEQTSHEGDDSPPDPTGGAKPQAVEKVEAAQTFITPPAGVQVETPHGTPGDPERGRAVTEATPPASAIPASEAPRPAVTSSAAAAQQSLHAQRQEADDHRVAEQAMRAVRSIVNQRGGSLTLRLNPPELGDLRIRLEMTQHAVSARLEVSSDAVRQLLQQQLPQLHSALSSHGLTVEQIQVQTQPSAGQQQSHGGDAHEDGRSRGGFDRQQERGNQRRDEPDSRSRFQRELLDLVA